MFNLKLVTPPAVPVIALADLKTYLRIDNAVEDALLESLEKAAVLRLEKEIDLKFITQTWDVFMDQFPRSSRNVWWDGTVEAAMSELITPAKNIILPIGSGTITEFSTYQDNSTAVNETMSDYAVDSVGDRCRIGPRLGTVWPTTVLRPNNGIRFRCVVGFGADASSVPDDIKQAVKAFVAHMYESRGDQNEMKIPPHILTMVDHYRRVKLGC